MGDIQVEPAQTRAVVVGIERYAPPVQDLEGPVRDACRFVRWLRRCGVPARQIDLFAAPLAANQAMLDDLDVPVQSARCGPIHDYFTRTLPERSAELFLLFWAGHGLLPMTAGDERRLLLADASRDDDRNLDLDALLASLHGDLFPGLPRQVAFIDACAQHVEHWPATEAVPQRDRRHGCRQFVLFGARAGYAIRPGGTLQSGAFSAALLDDLARQPTRPFPPDVRALSDRLVARFDELRAAGRTDRTPASYREQDGSGEVRRFGEIPRLRGPRPSPGAAFAYPRCQMLRSALLHCGAINDPDRRQGLLRDLRAQIRLDVAYYPATRPHLMAVIRACLNHPGGVEELAELVRDSEGDSPAMRQIDVWMDQNLTRG